MDIVKSITKAKILFIFHHSFFSQHITSGLVQHKAVMSSQPQQCGEHSLSMLLDSRDDQGHGGAVKPELHIILAKALMDKLLQNTVSHNLLSGVLKQSHSSGRE